MAIEEPKFIVLSKTEDYEIRKYDSICVAETEIKSDFENAGNYGFRILADYIFGNNKSKAKISMTAPVIQTPKSEKIAMTAPVTQMQTSSGFFVQFTMPANYTLENIPEPNDPRVIIKQIPSRNVAVYRYTGSWSKSRYETMLKKFREALLKNGVKVIGEPVFARFNSPFQLWFLRRNEIWLQVL